MELAISAGEATGGSIPALAEALRDLERRIEAERPDLVRLEDDSDAALAAALVAVKLGVPIDASEAATDPATANGRLIARIAAT